MASNGSTHLFPLPFLQLQRPATCPPARNRRSKQRRAFARLTIQISNLTIAAINVLAAGKPLMDCLTADAMYFTPTCTMYTSNCKSSSAFHAQAEKHAAAMRSSSANEHRAAATERCSADAATVRTNSPQSPALQLNRASGSQPPPSKQLCLPTRANNERCNTYTPLPGVSFLPAAESNALTCSNH